MVGPLPDRPAYTIRDWLKDDVNSAALAGGLLFVSMCVGVGLMAILISIANVIWAKCA